MPIETEIDRDHGILIHKVTGDLKPKDIQAAYAQLPRLPGYRLGMPVLYIFGHGSLAKLTDTEFEEITQIFGPHLKAAGKAYPVAFVAEKDIDYGLSRMYQVLGGHLPVKVNVFRNVADALAWLCPTSANE